MSARHGATVGDRDASLAVGRNISDFPVLIHEYYESESYRFEVLECNVLPVLRRFLDGGRNRALGPSPALCRTYRSFGRGECCKSPFDANDSIVVHVHVGKQLCCPFVHAASDQTVFGERCKEIVDALDGVKRLKKESWERLKTEMKNMLDLVDKYSSRGKIVRMFHADSFEEDFKENNAAINDALGMVTLNLAVDNQTRIAEMERREKLFKGLKAVLDPPNFAGEIKDAVARFTEGTREWAFNDFDEWVESKSEFDINIIKHQSSFC